MAHGDGSLAEAETAPVDLTSRPADGKVLGTLPPGTSDGCTKGTPQASFKSEGHGLNLAGGSVGEHKERPAATLETVAAIEGSLPTTVAAPATPVQVLAPASPESQQAVGAPTDQRLGTDQAGQVLEAPSLGCPAAQDCQQDNKASPRSQKIASAAPSASSEQVPAAGLRVTGTEASHENNKCDRSAAARAKPDENTSSGTASCKQPISAPLVITTLPDSGNAVAKHHPQALMPPPRPFHFPTAGRVGGPGIREVACPSISPDSHPSAQGPPSAKKYKLEFFHKCRNASPANPLHAWCSNFDCRLCAHKPKRACGGEGFNDVYFIKSQGAVITAKCGERFMVVLKDAQTNTFAPDLGTLRLEFQVLRGEFSEAEWTPEEFDSHVKQNEGGTSFLRNKECVMHDGIAYCPEGLSITQSSYRPGREGGKFRLGVRVVGHGPPQGQDEPSANGNQSETGSVQPVFTVMEGKSTPFIVKSGRVQGDQKKRVPLPSDEVSVLEHVGKEAQKRLLEIGICTVEDFRRFDQSNHNMLRDKLKLSIPGQRDWKETCDNARRAIPAGLPRKWENPTTKRIVFFDANNMNTNIIPPPANAIEYAQCIEGCRQDWLKTGHPNWSLIEFREAPAPAMGEGGNGLLEVSGRGTNGGQAAIERARMFSFDATHPAVAQSLHPSNMLMRVGGGVGTGSLSERGSRQHDSRSQEGKDALTLATLANDTVPSSAQEGLVTYDAKVRHSQGDDVPVPEGNTAPALAGLPQLGGDTTNVAGSDARKRKQSEAMGPRTGASDSKDVTKEQESPAKSVKLANDSSGATAGSAQRVRPQALQTRTASPTEVQEVKTTDAHSSRPSLIGSVGSSAFTPVAQQQFCAPGYEPASSKLPVRSFPTPSHALAIPGSSRSPVEIMGVVSAQPKNQPLSEKKADWDYLLKLLSQLDREALANAEKQKADTERMEQKKAKLEARISKLRTELSSVEVEKQKQDAEIAEYRQKADDERRRVFEQREVYQKRLTVLADELREVAEKVHIVADAEAQARKKAVQQKAEELRRAEAEQLLAEQQAAWAWHAVAVAQQVAHNDVEANHNGNGVCKRRDAGSQAGSVHLRPLGPHHPPNMPIGQVQMLQAQLQHRENIRSGMVASTPFPPVFPMPAANYHLYGAPPNAATPSFAVPTQHNANPKVPST